MLICNQAIKETAYLKCGDHNPQKKIKQAKFVGMSLG